MSKKKLREYQEKYGNIPRDFYERFSYLLNLKNIKKKDFDEIRAIVRRNKAREKKEISFVFYFYPDPTPRARYSRFTKAFYVKNALDYEKVFLEFLDSCENIETQISTPCEFYCTTYKPIPSGMNRIESVVAELGQIDDMSRPDWDNLGKTYSDMVQHRLLVDDGIIYKGVVLKKYSILPRIEIFIKYYTTHDSTYNKKKMENMLNRINRKEDETDVN